MAGGSDFEDGHAERKNGKSTSGLDKAEKYTKFPQVGQRKNLTLRKKKRQKNPLENLSGKKNGPV